MFRKRRKQHNTEAGMVEIKKGPLNVFQSRFAMLCTFLKKLWPENTHRWGKDHCTAGLQFNKTGTDQRAEWLQDESHDQEGVCSNPRSNGYFLKTLHVD